MKKLIIIILVLFSVQASAQYNFPSLDSLRRYINRFITNSAINAFTDYRLNTALNGMLRFIDSAGGGTATGLDSAWALNDSTLRFRSGLTLYNVTIRGGRDVDTLWRDGDTLRYAIDGRPKAIYAPTTAAQTIQQVINTGNTISENDSINVDPSRSLTIHGGTGSSIILKALQSAVSHSRVIIQPGLLGLEYRNLSSGNIKSLTMSSLNGITVTDQDSQTGLGYAANYRTNGIANFGDRWIPDWGTVKDSIAAAGGGGGEGTDSRLGLQNTTDTVYGFSNSYWDSNGQYDQDKSTGAMVATGWAKNMYYLSGGGRGLWYAAGQANRNLPLYNKNVVAVMEGLNDMRNTGASVKTFNQIIVTNRSILCAAWGDMQVPANNSTVTEIGSWADTTLNALGGRSTFLGGLGRKSTSTGDTLVWAFTGGNAFVSYIGTDSALHIGGTFEVIIDDSVWATVNTNNSSNGLGDGFDDNSRTPAVSVFFGLGSGSHTMKIVNTTTLPVYVDYFGTLRTQGQVPPVFTGRLPKMTITGYGANTDAADFNQADSVIQVAINPFQSRGYPVVVVNTNEYYTPSGSNILSDSVHPSPTGAALIAKAFTEASAHNGEGGLPVNSSGYMYHYMTADKEAMGFGLTSPLNNRWWIGRDGVGQSIFGTKHLSAATDNRDWEWITGSNSWRLRLLNSANNGSTDVLNFYRTGMTPDSAVLNALLRTTGDILNPTGYLGNNIPNDNRNFSAGLFGGSFGGFKINSPAGGTNQKKIRVLVTSNKTAWENLSDDELSANSFMEFTRSGVTSTALDFFAPTTITNSQAALVQTFRLINTDANNFSGVALKLHNNLGTTQTDGAGLEYYSSATVSPYSSALLVRQYEAGDLVFYGPGFEWGRWDNVGRGLLINRDAPSPRRLYVNGSAGIHKDSANLVTSKVGRYVLLLDTTGSDEKIVRIHPDSLGGTGGADGNGIYGGSGSLSGATTVTLGSDNLIFGQTSSGKIRINGLHQASGDYTVVTHSTDSSITQIPISILLQSNGDFTISTTTTDASPIGTTFTILGPSGQSVHLDCTFTAILNDGDGGYTAKKTRGFLKNAGGTVSAGTQVSVNADEYYGSGLSTATSTLGTVSGNPGYTITGETGKTILWTIKIKVTLSAAPL